MWVFAVPASHWNDIWGYWNEEGDKLFVTGPCNDFYFDLFHKMLFHMGFQNGDQPFYIGYVTAEVRAFMKGMRSYRLHICFCPSWRWVRDKGPICYIGKKHDTYYAILPHDFDPKRYRVRDGTYEKQPFCTIDETEWLNKDSNGELSDKSSVLDKVKWAKCKGKKNDHGEDVDKDIDNGADNNSSKKDDVEEVVDGEDIDKDIDDGEDNDNSKKHHVEQVVKEKHMTEGDQDGEAIEKEVLAADAMSGAEDKDIEDKVAQDEQIAYEPMDAEIRESKGKDNVMINDEEQITEVDVVTQEQSMMMFEKKNLQEIESNEGQLIQVQELVGNTTLEVRIDENQCVHDKQLEADGKDLSSLSKAGHDEGHNENDGVEKEKTNVDAVSKLDWAAVQNHDTNSHPNENEEIETFAPSSPDKTAKGEESIDTEDDNGSGIVIENENDDDSEKLSDDKKQSERYRYQ